jgi:[acyl-carrier-protein] S-malonyltransferase
MKIAVLFPGQGSQYLGMGKEFIEQDTECAALLAMAEAICEQPLGTLIADGPMEDLTRNARLQPAITVTNMICWHALKKAMNGFRAACFAGHSLGEYSALYAAGVVQAEDTLRLVAKRGALMEREGEANPGGMRAVLGLEIEAIEEIIGSYTGPGVITAANHNTPQQIVLSGSIVALDIIGKIAEEKGARVIPLNVSVANHSPLVAQAVPEFADFIADIQFREPATPVYFNVSAMAENDPEKIKGMMARQIASRVRWYEIITGMLAAGVDTFIEVGPKAVLKGMMKKIVPRGATANVLQCDSPETLAKCLESLS